MSLHRVISAVLGVLVACAGFIFLIGYAVPAVEDVFPLPPNVVIYGRTSLSERLLGAVISVILTAGAFWMAFRFLRFAFFSKKR